MMISQMCAFRAELYLTHIRADGTHRDHGCVSGSGWRLQPRAFLRSLWRNLRRRGIIPLTMGFLAFVAWLYREHPVMLPFMVGLVTDAGVDFMMGDFAAQGGIDITNFLFVETGTTATAESVAQTDLLGKISIARVSGTQSKPGTKQYQNLSTVTYNAGFTIAEWGLFSAAGSGLPPTGGTLWDRRLTGAVTVANTETITFTYILSGTSGGS